MIAAALAFVVPLFKRHWPIILGVLLVIVLIFGAYNRGGRDERDHADLKRLEEIEKQHKEREKIENNNRSLSDDDATGRLRPPP